MSSRQAIRVKDIPSDSPEESLGEFVKTQISSYKPPTRILPWSKSSKAHGQDGGEGRTLSSLAHQGEKKVGTISFSSKPVKEHVLKSENGATEWSIDDDFRGITVLHSPKLADIDICAVHGLGGNGFDTWMATTKMWLRDILAKRKPFNRSRIMTFGYNSDPMDGKATAGLRQWAIELLNQVGHIRSTEEEQARPIIFVCHSLGGLVGREAMIRLGTFPGNYSGISLEQCGMLFLSTPHSGTTEADWNGALLGIAEYAFGVRGRDVVDKLRSFNDSSVASKELFAALRPNPPFFCLCEGKKTTAFGKNRMIVTQDSASLNGVTAVEITDVDHSEICKFDRETAGFLTVNDRLLKLRQMLLKQPDLRFTHEGSGSLSQGGSAFSNAAALGRSRILQVYNNELNTTLYTPATSKTYFLAPPPSSEEFTGRDVYMLHLDMLLSEFDKHTRVALFDLGGIGKTRIALEFVYKWKNSKRSIFWVHAGTASRIEKGYLDIAKEVNIAGWDSQDPKIDKLLLVKNWFEGKSSGPWILVLDNADDIDLLYGTHDTTSRLADYFPRSSNGFILLTTRNKKVATKFTTAHNILSIPALAPKQSVQLLKAKVVDNVFDEDSYTNLSNILENVPLALVQAAAFISAESSSVSEYLRLYNGSETSKIRLLSEDFEDNVRDKEDTKNPVAATFTISFEHIRKSHPRAADLLSYMSTLDTQAIPTSLLPLDEDPVLSRQALGTLQAFSLITQTSQKEQQNECFDLHRLVQLGMRNWLNINMQLDSWTAATISVMSVQFPPALHENNDLCKDYLPHALVILSSSHAKIYDQITKPLQETLSGCASQATLQFRVSWYLMTKGEYTLANQIAQRSLILREKALGTEHPDTLISMGNLASVLDSQGKYKEAEELNRQTLKLSEKVLGTEHPSTLTTMSNLALVLTSQGKYKEAEELNRQTLKLREKVLGTEHPSTLTTMGNLASVLTSQGKYKEAEELNRQTLKLREKVLGTEHPSTLTTMSNLALVLTSQGKYKEAEELNRQTLKLSEKVLGTEHPDTLTTMSNLALVLDSQGKYKEAEELNRQTLKLSKKVLGTEHPSTLTTMSNLTSVLDRQGKYKEAEELNRQTLKLREKVLEPEHPSTLTSVYRLACLLQGQGRYHESSLLYQRACAGYQNILGTSHPITIACSKHYKSLLEAMEA